MTIEDPKLSQALKDADKLDVTLAVQIASYLKDEIQKLEDHVAEQVRAAINANAQTVKRIEEMESAFRDLRSGLEKTRIDRAEKEIKEAEARLKIALDHKDGLSTQEKIEVKKTMDERLADLEKDRREKQKAWWKDKVLPGLTTGLIMIIAGPIGLAFFIAILVFVLRALGIEVQLPS